MNGTDSITSTYILFFATLRKLLPKFEDLSIFLFYGIINMYIQPRIFGNDFGMIRMHGGHDDNPTQNNLNGNKNQRIGNSSCKLSRSGLGFGKFNVPSFNFCQNVM